MGSLKLNMYNAVSDERIVRQLKSFFYTTATTIKWHHWKNARNSIYSIKSYQIQILIVIEQFYCECFLQSNNLNSILILEMQYFMIPI